MEILFFILFAAVIFKNLLSWTALWQLKEYRLDRFWYFIKTPEGRAALFNRSFVFETLALASLFLFDWLAAAAWQWQFNAFGSLYVFSVGSLTALKFVSVIFAVELSWFLVSLIRRSFFKPNFTGKASLILALSWTISTLVFYFVFSAAILNSSLKAGLAINMLSVLIIGLVVLIIYPLSYFLKRQAIASAKRKIASLTGLKIVGITGSYGKTSVKEFAYQLIKTSLKTVKTAKNNNSEMGVAQTILNHDFSKEEIFIAEMAAYKIGEIKKICQICPPDVAVMTGLDQQHSALFGSQENIVKAKSEIINFSRTGAWLILNYDNNLIRNIKLPADRKVLTYGINNGQTDLSAKSIVQQNSWQNFKLVYAGQEVNCRTKLIGKHNILNILAAIGVGLACGLKLEELARGIQNLEPVERTMNVIERGKLTLIDDSYNANPSGVLAALATLDQFKAPKIVILDDILELGVDQEAVHLKIVKALAQIDNLDKVILCGKNFSKFVNNKLVASRIPADKIILTGTGGGEAIDYLKKVIDREMVVLFEGRRSEIYLKQLLNYKP
ncbi:MAG: UDP-N-acetylmuramoyl-tripeptide--D-alanyl-D-alanine ligase [Candidatus Komeilibacteria bacterium]|nr:UDP-N-acetylmuramoyl-tripeptide--D-alanyl-D-alanine ligase [Candidatus Komeilibacteria bacterium]